MSSERDTAGWNCICAAFIPGTVIPTNKTEIVSIMDSSDDDGESGSGAAAPRSSSSRASSPSTKTSSVRKRKLQYRSGNNSSQKRMTKKMKIHDDVALGEQLA